MLPEEITEAAPAAEQAAPEAPQLTPFAQRIADLRAEPAPAAPEAVTPAAEPEAAAEAVPEAGEASEKVEESSEAAVPAEIPGGTAIVAKLPGRRPDDPEFELPLDAAALEAAGVTPEQALERVNQLRNEAMRRAQFVEAMEGVNADRAELDSFEEALRTDPGGFLSERVPAAVQEAVVEKLLKRLPQEAWERVADKMAAWDKEPAARDTEATKEENARLRAEQKRRDDLARSRSEGAEVKDIGTAIANLVPAGMEEAEGDEFFDYAVHKLQQHVEKNAEHFKKNKLDPAQVPQILADLGVLRRFGLDESPTPAAKPAAASPARPKGPAAPAPAKPTVQTGADLKRRVETRRDAATAPAGAGSGSSGQPLPKGQTFDQRVASLRERFGLAGKK